MVGVFVMVGEFVFVEVNVSVKVKVGVQVFPGNPQGVRVGVGVIGFTGAAGETEKFL